MKMQILCRGVKKSFLKYSDGNIFVFTLALLFAFSLVLSGIGALVGAKYETVLRESNRFYMQETVRSEEIR
ncbi:MAG TPA: hypothetical protein DCZ74_05150 [Treponema sp.]|jgi:hypothetical protein|nr:hypothetical protein [Treponema sp.]